jgi:hypothetical protein
MTTPPIPIAAPPPNLRIVPTDRLYPHEKHDSQRLIPLVERIRHESVMINPPIVAPMGDDKYVVLDGANRTSAFARLSFPHILVQVVPYDSPYVQLETWQHVVCAWSPVEFMRHLDKLTGISLVKPNQTHNAITPLAHIQFRDGDYVTIDAQGETAERNQVLNQFVAVYQRNAVLHRTALTDSDHVWSHHADGIALVLFPPYRPADVIAAVREDAYIPPGITRHIIHGRALRVNYPLEWLRDTVMSLDEKNRALAQWMEDKVNHRHVRYYAESTYQFDE